MSDVSETGAAPPSTRLCGIYAIYSAVNGRQYIGSARDIADRWGRHRRTLRKGTHRNIHLQRAWDKYGEEAFEFNVLEECDEDQLLIREQHYIDKCENRYNIALVAGSPLGVTRSLVTRAKISEARRGTKASPEARANMSAAKMGNTNLVGYKHSDETRAKMSAVHMGHEVSDETRERLSGRMKGNTINVGRKHTDEARANMSAAKIGNTNAAGNTNCLGYKHTDEARANMSASQRGRKHSAESKAKMSAAKKLYWERKRAEENNDG